MQEKQEIQILSLGWEDALEKEMATHSSILAWKILWTEEPGVANSPWGHKESDMTEYALAGQSYWISAYTKHHA